MASFASVNRSELSRAFRGWDATQRRPVAFHSNIVIYRRCSTRHSLQALKALVRGRRLHIDALLLTEKFR